jgi:hypothetical protein
MKGASYPDDQPKDPVSDALPDRNSDPDAQAQDAPLKVHGDALLGSKAGKDPKDARSDDGPPDGTRDEGF